MPKNVKNALNAKSLDSLAPGKYHDGAGLIFRVDQQGNRNWVQRVKQDNGKESSKGLGVYPAVSLAEARKAGAEAKRRMASGSEPIPAILTFAEVADEFAEGWTAGLKRQRYMDEWKASLRIHAFPKIGHLPVAEVGTDDVLAVLTPIWGTVPKTAKLVRQRMEKVFDWAILNKYRRDANPAAKYVTSVLPKVRRQPERRKAVHHADVPMALEQIQLSTSLPVTRLCYRFLVLTAVRSGEAREADWSEIDWNTATWVIPAERTKAGRQHRVPLSLQAMEVLRSVHRVVPAYRTGPSTGMRSEEWPDQGLIFPAPTGREFAPNVFSTATKKMGLDCVPHGFRSSFRNWCAESGVPRDNAEASLGHILGENQAENAYLRTDLLDERRPLMQAWADYCTGRTGSSMEG